MTYDESLNYLEKLAKFGIRPGLERINGLLARLGEPQKKYKTIHVTGTNGKGSVTYMLTRVLAAAGYRTGMYSSPHLVSYTERMTVNGAEISPAEFAALAEKLRVTVDEMLADGEDCPTQFEFLTAMAFQYFADQRVDYAVIEVGLGGLLDSTNVIFPELAIITNVALEHADKCGGTLAGVARHKAGIIKKNVPVVTGATGIGAEVIKKRAADEAARVYLYGKDFSVNVSEAAPDNANRLMFSDGKILAYELSNPAIYQRLNSALVIKAARVLNEQGAKITDDIIKDALKNAAWPGRFEIFSCGARSVIVDGAHNPAGMAALRESLDAVFPDAVRVFLLGVLQDKDIAGMLAQLFQAGDKAVVTLPDSDRAAQPETVVKMLGDITGEAVAENEPETALKIAWEKCSPGDIMVVTGSLYLIGHIRELLTEKYGAKK